MNIKVKINHKNLAAIEDIAEQALVKTADAIKTDVQQSQTMHFKTVRLLLIIVRQRISRSVLYPIHRMQGVCIFTLNIILVIYTTKMQAANGLNRILREKNMTMHSVYLRDLCTAE